MFLTSIRRKKKSSAQDSLTGFKKRRMNSENYSKTRKLIDELNLEEVFGENVKVCGYSRNEDVNQNVRNKEFVDVITIDIEVERVKNDVSKKKKDSSETKQDWLSIRTRGSPKMLYNLMKNLSPSQMKDIIDIGFGSIIGMASEEIPGKIAHFVVDNFDDDSMKLKLSNGVISITPELVYKVLGVPLGGEDINRMNRLGSEDVTTLEWHSQFSRKNPTPKKVYDKIQEPRMGGIFFKLNFLVLFSKAMGLSRKGGQCRPDKSIIGYINEETKIESLDWCKYVCMCLKMSKIYWIRDGENSYYSGPLIALTLDSKMDKLDHKVTLLKLIIKDLEFEFSNSLMDHPNSSRLKDIKAKYNGIIQNTDLFDFGYAIEDNNIHHESQYGNVFSEMDYNLNFNDMSGNYNVGDSEEEMIEEVNQKIIEADIVHQKSINNDVQNKELNCIDEDFHKVRKSNIQNEEQMFVKVTHEEKEEEILNQDSIEVNVLKVIEADSMAEKSTQDDIGNEYRKNKMIIINKDEDEFNVFNDIKPDIKDASIRVQPKHEPSIAWCLKSLFKVRGSALYTYANTLSQTKVLTADILFIMVKETDPIEIVYSSCTNNVKIPRLFLESLAPGLKIDELVIDAWADLLNFNERYKSANSPSRYFFKPILMLLLRISVFDEYVSKNIPQIRASIFRNVEPERMKMIRRTNENEFNSGVFIMSHMIIILVNQKVNGNMGSARNLRSRLSNLNFS
nr:hypothetical protein [Tanacetum cinerariifolium]